MIKGFKGKRPNIDKSVYIADGATIIGDVTIGKDSSIFPGVVLRGDMNYIKIGKNVSVQDNAVMHGTLTKYSTTVGDNVSVGHNAIVHGCRVGDNCIIGMGAIILEGSEIGEWCIIGAGSVIPEGAKIPSNSIVMGVPGRVVKKTTPEHRERITNNWKEYVKLKDEYLDETQ